MNSLRGPYLAFKHYAVTFYSFVHDYLMFVKMFLKYGEFWDHRTIIQTDTRRL